jgi:Rieske Fe-S protein
MSTISRRHALAGAATVGVGVPLLAACGDDSETSGATDPAGDTTSAAPASSAPRSADTGTGSSSAPAGSGIATSEVPVGGGIIEDDTVITQPTKGDFKAFSATCTHQGCLVTSIDDGFIVCPCHGSHFAIDTGAPTSDSLATAPLGAVDITVSDGRITLG